MRSADDLSRVLRRIDGRGYKAYKDIRGSYACRGFDLHIDHVQGDPFAAPSKIRTRVPASAAGLPTELHGTRVRRTALEDFLARKVRDAIRRQARRAAVPGPFGTYVRAGGERSAGGRRGSGKSGLMEIDAGAQEVLERTAVRVGPGWVEARLQVGLPAAGRRVLGREAERMLLGEFPRIVEGGLLWKALPRDEGRLFVECVENQESIRAALDGLGLAAFVADGSILPRASGVSDRPLPAEEAVAFRSPESLRVSVPVPNPVPGPGGGPGPRGGPGPGGPLQSLSGMGVPKGVTLIVGGGYHGKSTLLRALERGVYPHVPGDGREYVVASRDLVKIRAEDGRRVERVDISPFISHLPRGRSTVSFSTEEASGSTSQAANILEALEVGAAGLLLDEDTSATNFMLRDARMQELVSKDSEPITPFLDRVRELFESRGVSTVLVTGGCGDYFDAADTVILMREYVPEDATAEAKRIARERGTERRVEVSSPLPEAASRVPLAEGFDPSRGRREVKIDAKGVDLVAFGTQNIDLWCVEQLVDPSQTRAVGYALHMAAGLMDGGSCLREIVDRVEATLDERGPDALDPFGRGERHPGNLARPRRYEIAAAANRLRTARFRIDR